MSKEPPTYTGIPVRGCHFQKDACRFREDPAGTGYLLEREPSNPYDANAIRVVTDDGEMTGYLGAEYAALIAPWMEAGWWFTCTKTRRLGCYNIVTVAPIRKAQKETEVSITLRDFLPAGELDLVEEG